MRTLKRRVIPAALLAAAAILLSGCGNLLPTPSDEPPTSVNGVPTETQEASIVFIGDSIMSGYGTENGKGWPDLLAEESERPILNLGCAGAGFVNVGVCGEDYVGLVTRAAESNPQVVVIQGSDNDFVYELDTVKEATAATVKELRTLLPNARIIGLNTVMGRYDEFQEPTDVTSELVKSAVEANGGDFVNIGQPLGNSGNYLQFDQEHPTEEGQTVLAKAAKDGLASANVLLEYTF